MHIKLEQEPVAYINVVSTENLNVEDSNRAYLRFIKQINEGQVSIKTVGTLKTDKIILNYLDERKNSQAVVNVISIKNNLSIADHNREIIRFIKQISEGELSIKAFKSNKTGKIILQFEKVYGDDIKNEISNNNAYKEIEAWIKIYKDNNFNLHYQVNNYISKHNIWDLFPTIRAHNDHGDGKVVNGILPQYYRKICIKLDIGGGQGDKLKESIPY